MVNANGTADAPVRAVWTDFGGVLAAADDKALASLCRRLGVRPELLRRAAMKVAASFGTEDLMEPLDTPLVSEAEWTALVEAALEEDFGVRVRIGDLGAAWFEGREVDHAWLDQLRAARSAGVFVGMISNMVPAWDAHWRALVPADELFDHVLLSYRVGCRKPMPRIYELASRAADVPPAQCVLIDDLALNCAGAEAAGWRAIRFTDAAAAAAQLARLVAAGQESRNPEKGTADV
jgi:putative hydrolase of the HAD superfamily